MPVYHTGKKASGARNDRQERKKVMALARAHEIDAILVNELSRWKVSVLAQAGLSFDLSTASGKLMRTIMAAWPNSSVI